jgi:hypothetical protein
MIEERIFPMLLKANTSSDIDEIISNIKNEIEWVPLGGKISNSGPIQIGSEPYDGITERITNAIDAMIELNVELNPEYKQIKNPRNAIEKIYGIKEGNLRYAEGQIGSLASNIKLKFLDGDEAKRPTIEIIDRGIGQHPTDFPSTLLSLNEENKVSKFYLIGAFGQGGQTSFRYCKNGYGIVISRKHPKLLRDDQKDEIGWSIVRYWDPSTEDQMWKTGSYQYCVAKNTKKILTFNQNKMPIAFEHGTIIRLISYGLSRGTSNVLQAANTAWSYISQSLFDPILPIRIYEGRKQYENDNRSLAGLAPRLWHGGRGENVTISMKNEYDVNLGKDGKIKINYWCLIPIAEPGEKINWRDRKKGFVSGNNAVFITLNGQRHGIETTTFLRDNVGLGYSYDHIIVQVDCDNLSNMAKKDLTSSTRERLVEGGMKEKLFEEVTKHLKDDRNIIAFEKDQMDQIIRASTVQETTKIRRLVGQYIVQNKELSDFLFKPSEDTTKAEKENKEKPEKHPDEKEPENDISDDITLKELEIPELKMVPSYITITNKKDPIRIEKGGTTLIRLETDAIDSYLDADHFSRLKFSASKNILKEKSHSQLRNGKFSFYIYCPTTTRIGTKELIKFELETGANTSLTVERNVICVEPQKKKKIKQDVKIREPNIITINHLDPIWKSRNYDENSVGEIFLSAKDKESAILVSTENSHLEAALKKIDDIKIDISKDRYVATIAYYLLLREVDKRRKIKVDNVENTNDKNSVDIDPKASPELQRVTKAISVLILPIESI